MFFKIQQIFSTKSLIYLVIIGIFIIFFFFHEHYPITDEIYTFENYIGWKNFLWKSDTNNHLLISFIGTLSQSLFGFNFLVLRFCSFLIFSIILIFYSQIFKTYTSYIFLILVIFTSDLIFNYIILFRGYYISSLLFIIIFHLLYKYDFKSVSKIRLILILNTFLTIHSLFTLYLVLPILLSLFYLNFKRKSFKFFVKEWIYFYLIPTLILYFIIIVVTGFVQVYSYNYTNFENINIFFIFTNLIEVIKNSIFPGIKFIFFNQHTSPGTIIDFNFFETFEHNLLFLKKNNLIILIILSVSFLILVYNFLSKKKNIFDYIVLLFFIFYILFNKFLYSRIYLGFIFFFIFYICLHIENSVYLRFKFNIYKYFSFILTIILILISRPNLEKTEYNNLRLLIKSEWIKTQSCSEVVIFRNLSCSYFLDKDRKLNLFK